MTESDDPRRQIRALRERIYTLNAAILRISATLDVDTVLREVVESARELTGARYGVIATVEEEEEEEEGTLQDFFSGFTPEEQQELFTWPDSGRLFEHLRELPGPLRLADLSGYVRSLDIAPARTFSRTFQGTPMRHRGEDVGHFFLAEKADGEAFTDDDEEVLTLFASQAAAAITNARTHRRERHARADLKALVETSPVGVVVLDARAGRPVSFNREARRIVESLRTPGHPAEQLLEVISVRRADGREVSLAEMPLVQTLGTGETVRAEEVVLSVPDGRSVRTLINATPIRVAAVREDAHVAVSVSDEGSGVAPEALPHLFSKHAAAGQGVTAGHGLGLAISKGLVEAHGGRIRAESPGAGRGATFTFTLPVASEAGAAVPAAVPPADPEPGDPPRILVVDDDPRALRFVRDALSEAGYAPLLTGMPQDLPRIIRTERPRLVLLDLMLPEVDGIELMAQVPELADLPVIFISAYGREETDARALDSGAADYIVKPFSPTELVARVRAALRRREEPRPFVVGELAIDYGRRRVTLGDEAVELTATEYELLRVLSLDAGRVVDFDTLLRRVWAKREKANANLVRIFVRSLRRKLGDSADSPAYIFNQRGVGYRMAKPPVG